MEDEAIVAADLQDRLTRLGYAVCGVAASGEQAIALAREHRPRLALMDIQLHGAIDGIQVAQTLRAELDVAVIFLSANSDEAMLRRARLAGPYGYALKPFKERELQINIEVSLQKHESDRQLAAAHLQVRQLNSTLEQRVRERTAELEAALSETEAIAQAVAHHLRSPLRAIEGFSHLLRTQLAAGLPEQAAHLPAHLPRAIQANAIRMGRLVDDLLRFINLRGQPLQATAVDTAALVHDVVNELAASEPARVTSVRVDALPACYADPMLLRQVFVELLSNAFKFRRDGQAHVIVVGSRPPEAPSRQQVYFVRDNGIGIDVRYADKLFKLFSQLNRPEAYEGTGAGLAMARRILERLNGRIWVEPSLEGGAMLLIAVPSAP